MPTPKRARRSMGGPRFRRDRRAQVSAVATILGLLLLVSFISTYTLGPLPDQEAQNEFAHTLLVENQLARLQTTLVAQSQSIDPQLLVVSPLTLGSDAVPPFGPPARGDLSFFSNGTGAVWNNLLGSAQYHAPSFGNGTLCGGRGGGSCSNSATGTCAPPLTDNYSISNARFTYSLSGSADCVFVNVTGDHDVLNVVSSGSDLPALVFTLFGNDDFVNVAFSGSDIRAQFQIFGAQDSYNVSLSGSTDRLATTFVGETNPTALCPFGNASSTDTANATASGSTDRQNLTWVNNVGYSTPFAAGPFPGPGLGNVLGWANVSATVACAFYSTQTHPAPNFGFGGITVALENGYSSTALLGFEGGGVFLGSSNGQSVLVDPPLLHFYTTTQGRFVNVTFFSFVGQKVFEQGYATAGVGTQVLGTSHYDLTVGLSHNQFVSEPVLNLTTRFPLAWYNFLSSAPSAFFGGPITCTTSPGLSARCLTPPPGVAVQLSAHLNVVGYSVTYIEVAVSIY